MRQNVERNAGLIGANMLKRWILSAFAAFAVGAWGAETAWKEAVDGNWAVAANWTNGVPTVDSVVRLPPYSTDYTVTFNSETDNVIGRLLMSNDQNLSTVTTTTLRVEKPLTIRPSSRINIYRYGQIVIPEGGKLTVESTSSIAGGNPAFFLNYRGSLLHVDGGTFEMTNLGYLYCCNGWSTDINKQPPEVRITAGDFRIVHTNTAYKSWLYLCYGYNKLNMTGGRLVLVGHSGDQNAYDQRSDIESLNLSGTATILTTNASFQISRGGAVFGGSSRLDMSGGRFYLGRTDTDNMKAELTLKDNSVINLYDVNFSQFGSGVADKKCTVTANIEGGNHTNALWNVWGCGKGTTTVNVTGGISHINRFGLVVAAPWFYANTAGHSTTGTVNVSGGVLSVTAEHNKWSEALGRITGFIIGNGAVNASSGYLFDGRLNVSGNGIVTNGAPFVVGIGLAEGSVTQTGGEIYSYATFAENANGGNAVAIGMCGAKGTYSVSDGNSTFFAPVWVGGMVTNHLHRRPFNIPPGSNGSRTSTGTLAVSGGSFRTKSDMYVGCDGTGTIDVSGGTLQVDGNLVLSNAVKSVLNVTLADGVASPTVAVGGNFVVTDGAEISVDGTAIDSGSKMKRTFLTCASAGDLNLDSIRVTGIGCVRKRNLPGGGVALAYNVPRGIVVSFR